MNERSRDIADVSTEHGVERRQGIRLWLDMLHDDAYPRFDRPCHLDPDDEGVSV